MFGFFFSPLLYTGLALAVVDIINSWSDFASTGANPKTWADFAPGGSTPTTWQGMIS